MNVLRFPIQLRTGKNQFMCEERLKEKEENETIPDENTYSIEKKQLLLVCFSFFSFNEQDIRNKII
jgi:hypothetical protein